jgi:hypothetical protein
MGFQASFMHAIYVSCNANLGPYVNFNLYNHKSKTFYEIIRKRSHILSNLHISVLTTKLIIFTRFVDFLKD